MENHDSRHEVTRILHELEQGETDRVDELLTVVYGELRRLAAAYLSRERSDHTLQPTALVHEAYLRIFQGSVENWACRRHFFGAAAEAMRRILIESARRKHSKKRGGEFVRSEIDIDAVEFNGPSSDFLDLNDALEELEKVDSESAELVKLRYFAGLTFEQIGELMGFSIRTAKNRWVFARAWLYQRLNETQ